MAALNARAVVVSNAPIPENVIRPVRMVRPGTTLYICPGGVISTRWILLSDVQGVKAGIFAPFIRKQYHLFNIPQVIQFIAKGGKVRLLIEPNTCFPCLTPFSIDNIHPIIPQKPKNQ